VTDTTPTPADDQASTAERMRAIAAGLDAAGLDAQVNETCGVLDVTASLHCAGSKDLVVICDEDHYIQVSWWNDPAATPAQLVAVISRALAAITSLS